MMETYHLMVLVSRFLNITNKSVGSLGIAKGIGSISKVLNSIKNTTQFPDGPKSSLLSAILLQFIGFKDAGAFMFSVCFKIGSYAVIPNVLTPSR